MQGLTVQNAETFLKLPVVVKESTLHHLLAFEVRQLVDHLGTHLSSALDNRFNEVDKVLLIDFVEFNNHASIDDIDRYLFLILPDHLHDVQLLGATLNIQHLESLSVEVHAFNGCFKVEESLFDVRGDLTEHRVGLLLYLDEDVASVAVSVDEVILHQHLEKCNRTQSSDHFVQDMSIFLVVSHGHSFDESLN